MLGVCIVAPVNEASCYFSVCSQKIHSQLTTSGSETAYDNATGRLNAYGESFVRKGRSGLEGDFAVHVFNIFNSCPAFRAANGPSVGFNNALDCLNETIGGDPSGRGGGGGGGGSSGGGGGASYKLPASVASNKSTSARKLEAMEHRGRSLDALLGFITDSVRGWCRMVTLEGEGGGELGGGGELYVCKGVWTCAFV